MTVGILRNNRYEGRFRVDGQPFALIQKTGHGWELVWLYGPHPKYPTKGSAAIGLERLAERYLARHEAYVKRQMPSELAAAPSLWSAGLNGGDSFVFWSGYNQGARDIAESLGGTSLESTPIGGVLDYLSNTSKVSRLDAAWSAASATFVGNAYATARAVILAPGVTWTTVEAPILTANEVTILFIGL